MDYFATMISFFTTAPTEVEGSSFPTNEDTGGGSSNAYCVVAWAPGVHDQVFYYISSYGTSTLL